MMGCTCNFITQKAEAGDCKFGAKNLPKRNKTKQKSKTKY